MTIDQAKVDAFISELKELLQSEITEALTQDPLLPLLMIERVNVRLTLITHRLISCGFASPSFSIRLDYPFAQYLQGRAQHLDVPLPDQLLLTIPEAPMMLNLQQIVKYMSDGDRAPLAKLL